MIHLFFVFLSTIFLSTAAFAQQPGEACSTVVVPKTITPVHSNQPPCAPSSLPDSQPTVEQSRCKTVCVTIPTTYTYTGFRVWVDELPSGFWNPGLNNPDRSYNGPNQTICMPIMNWSHNLDRTAHLCAKYTQ